MSKWFHFDIYTTFDTCRLRFAKRSRQIQYLIQIIQRGFIIRIERPVLARTDTRQHPRIGIGTGGRSGNRHCAYRRGAFIYRLPAAAERTVHVIGMAEAYAMPHFMRQNAGYGALWLVANGI